MKPRLKNVHHFPNDNPTTVKELIEYLKTVDENAYVRLNVMDVESVNETETDLLFANDSNVGKTKFIVLNG